MPRLKYGQQVKSKRHSKPVRNIGMRTDHEKSTAMIRKTNANANLNSVSIIEAPHPTLDSGALPNAKISVFSDSFSHIKLLMRLETNK